MLTLLGVAELLGMSLWFAGSAVAPQYAQIWDLSPSEAAWLTTVVQLGFVAGTALSAVLNLADVVPARWLFAGSALLGAAANAALLASPGYGGTLFWRFVTGMMLAGVYPPAMKMAATWFRARRGLAVGVVVGALTVGKALPFLVHAAPNASIPYSDPHREVAALIGSLLVAAAYQDGPYPFAVRDRSPGSSSARSPRNGAGATSWADTSVTCSSCTARGRGSRRSSRPAWLPPAHSTRGECA
jgi:hypothetical protein